MWLLIHISCSFRIILVFKSLRFTYSYFSNYIKLDLLAGKPNQIKQISVSFYLTLKLNPSEDAKKNNKQKKHFLLLPKYFLFHMLDNKWAMSNHFFILLLNIHNLRTKHFYFDFPILSPKKPLIRWITNTKWLFMTNLFT